MSLSLIRAELDADPDGRGYSTMDDAAAAADMNVKRFYAEHTPKVDIERYILEQGLWPGIEDLAGDTSADSYQRGAARTLVRLLNSAVDSVALDRPKVVGMIDQLVSSGVISADDKAAVMALRTPISWAEREGISRVRTGHVQAARAM